MRVFLVLVAALAGLLFLAGCNGDSSHASSLNTSGVASPTYEAESPTPFVYITPTPEFGLPGPDTILQEAVAAGTATRIWQLTAVPTWPPGVPRVYPTVPPSTPYSPIPTKIAGIGIIHESGNVDRSTADGVFSNFWEATIDGHVVTVYAGLKSNVLYYDQGIVLVVIEDDHRHILAGPYRYETPLRAGAVEIVDGVGQQLTLQAENGTLFYFDVATRQWVTPPQPTP